MENTEGYLGISMKTHKAMIDTKIDREKALGVLAVGFGLLLLSRSEAQVSGRRVIVHVLLL